MSVADNQKTLVFDLDGIVLYHVPTDSQGEKVIHVVDYESKGGDTASKSRSFRMADGFPEAVQQLLHKGWRISFFSFGTKTRNESALAQIFLPDGRSVLQASRDSGGKVYSNTDGYNLNSNDTRTVIDTSLPKSERPQIVKSLKRAMGPHAAANAFIIEDILSNVAPDER